MISPTRRQVPFAFPSTREMNHIFHAIDHDEEEELKVENWLQFIAKCDKDFDNNPVFHKLLGDELCERFGSSIDPGEFPAAFEECVRLIGQLKRTGNLDGIKSIAERKNTKFKN